LTGLYKKRLDAKGPVLALKMELQSRTTVTQLIHHSDRGVQYCSWAYVDLLRDSNVEISMCSSAEPNENSMAERLNRTLKGNFNLKGFISFCEASEVIERVIKTYNDYRPHASLDYRTPKQAHQSIGSQILKWYPYKKIRFSNVIRKPVNTA